MLIASATDSLITAAAGILGAVFGTLVTSYTTRKAERERQKAEGAAAWRLLRSELGNALDAVHEIRADGAWPIGWHRSWSDVWQEVRRPLFMSPPAEVDDEALKTVERACAVVGQLENAVNERRPDKKRPLTGRDQIFLWRLQSEVLGPACHALGAVSNVVPPGAPTDDELKYWARLPERRATDCDDEASGAPDHAGSGEVGGDLA